MKRLARALAAVAILAAAAVSAAPPADANTVACGGTWWANHHSELVRHDGSDQCVTVGWTALNLYNPRGIHMGNNHFLTVYYYKSCGSYGCGQEYFTPMKDFGYDFASVDLSFAYLVAGISVAS
jgi:hypothetical protein